MRGTVARDSVLLFAAQLSGNAGFFVAVLIVARSLGPEGRGVLGFITVGALLVARVSSLGLGETTTVFAAQRPDDRPALLSNLLAFSVSASLVGGLVVAGVLLAVPDARPSHLHPTQIAILVGAGVAASLWDESFLLGCGRLRPLALRIATGGWIYAVAVVVTELGPGLTVTSAAVAWVVAHCLVGLFLHAAVLREFGLRRPDLPLLRETVRFGFRAWIGSLSLKLNSRFDQVLMGFLATEAALGIYAIAVNASELLLYLPSAIATALIPTIARESGPMAGERTMPIFRAATLIAIGSVAVAALAGPVLVPLAFGDAFRPSVAPFLWLLPGVIGYTAMSIFSSALLARSAPGLSSLGPLAALVTGIALDIALIPSFDASGAAAAATGAFVVGGAVALVLFRRETAFSWRALVPGPHDAGALWRLPRQLRRG